MSTCPCGRPLQLGVDHGDDPIGNPLCPTCSGCGCEPEERKTMNDPPMGERPDPEDRPSREKPPIGLMPRALHDEARRAAVDAAIERYENAGLPVPAEWLDEATAVPGEQPAPSAVARKLMVDHGYTVDEAAADSLANEVSSWEDFEGGEVSVYGGWLVNALRNDGFHLSVAAAPSPDEDTRREVERLAQRCLDEATHIQHTTPGMGETVGILAEAAVALQRAAYLGGTDGR